MTKKFEVITPWYGVEKGQILTKVGKNFMPNVRLVTANSGDGLEKKNKELKSKLKKSEEQVSLLQGRIVDLENKLLDSSKDANKAHAEDKNVKK